MKKLTESKLRKFCLKGDEYLGASVIVKEEDGYYAYYCDRSAVVRVPCAEQPVSNFIRADRMHTFVKPENKMVNLKPWDSRHIAIPLDIACSSNPKCKICQGTVMKDMRYHRLAPLVYIAVGYHKMVSALPNARYEDPEADRPYSDPVFFAFDGGIGAVMPVRVRNEFISQEEEYAKHLPGVPVFVDIERSIGQRRLVIDTAALSLHITKNRASQAVEYIVNHSYTSTSV